MDKFWFKALMFIIIIGGLALIGFRYMQDHNMDTKRITAKDIRKIYETETVIGDVDYIEIQIATEGEEGIGYSTPVKINNKNDVSYLVNELNNCEKISDEDVLKGAGYDEGPLVTFYMSDKTILYAGVTTAEDGNTEFFVAKSADYGDKINYKLLANDQIEQYVKSLYSKYNVRANEQLEKDDNTNEKTNVNTNTNTNIVSNANVVNNTH